VSERAAVSRDQAAHVIGEPQAELQRQYPTPRLAQHIDAAPIQGIQHRGHLLDEPLETPQGRILGPVPDEKVITWWSVTATTWSVHSAMAAMLKATTPCPGSPLPVTQGQSFRP